MGFIEYRINSNDNRCDIILIFIIDKENMFFILMYHFFLFLFN